MSRSRTTRTVSSTLASRVMVGVKKTYGTSVMKGGDVKLQSQGVISTRCSLLDDAIGRGGIPFGRLTIITGENSTGKTTLALHIAAEAQARGAAVVFGDAEHKLDLVYAANLGVNTGELLVGVPTTLEQFFGLSKKAVESVGDAELLIILDSMNATIPMDDYEKEFEEHPKVASQARVMAWALPRLLEAMKFKKVALVFISQVRDMIGATGPAHFKQQKVIGCGNAPAFYASLVIELSRRKHIKEGDRHTGQNVSARIIKSQIGIPWKTADYRINWGTGIDQMHALAELSVIRGIVNRGSGGWHEMPVDGKKDPLKWHGQDNFIVALQTDPALREEVEKRIEEKRRKK